VTAEDPEEIDAVHARVEEDAAPALRAAIDPWQRRRLEALDQRQRVERTDRGDVGSDGGDGGVEPKRLCHHRAHAARVDGTGDSPRVRERVGEWLLDQQGLAGRADGLGDRRVEHRRHRGHDGVDTRVVDEILPASVVRAAVRGGERFACSPVAPAERHHMRLGHVLGDVTHVPRAVLAGADHADAETTHGV
jgi:hypothetical protein